MTTQTFPKTRKTKCFSRKSQQSVDFKLNTQIPDFAFTGTNAGVMGTNTDENNDVKATKDEEDDKGKVKDDMNEPKATKDKKGNDVKEEDHVN